MAYYKCGSVYTTQNSNVGINSASGDIASFQTNLAMALNKLKISFSAYQASGTPTPSVPIPISGFSSAELVDCGINVWDEQWEVGGLNINTGANADNLTDRIRSKNYIKVLPSAAYYFVAGTVGQTAWQFTCLFYDGSKNFISGSTIYVRNDVRTTPSNAYYMRFMVTSGYGTSYGKDISVNYPNTDHDYHAYNGTSVVIPFGDTYYGCKIDVVHGKLKVLYKLYTFTGTEAFGSLNNNRIYCTFLTDAYIPTRGTEKCAISSHYKGGAQNGYSNGEIYKATGNIAVVFVDDVNGVDVNTFKTFLANQNTGGTPVTIAYKIATPIEIDIDSAIITALTGEVNNVYCDIPTSEVELQYKAVNL